MRIFFLKILQCVSLDEGLKHSFYHENKSQNVLLYINDNLLEWILLDSFFCKYKLLGGDGEIVWMSQFFQFLEVPRERAL